MKMVSKMVFGIVLTLSMVSSMVSAEEILGNWKTQSGVNASITKCDNSFCVKLTSGNYSGMRIGQLNANGGQKYKGWIKDPEKNKKYTGKATVKGNSLSLAGCVLGGLVCRSQKWSRM